MESVFDKYQDILKTKITNDKNLTTKYNDKSNKGNRFIYLR